VVAEFAVVIVLDDQVAARFCPFYQFQPVGNGHHAAHGHLVGRGDVHHRAAACPEDLQVEAVRSDGNGDDGKGIIPEDGAWQVVAGIFDRHGRMALLQQVGDDVQALLEPGADHDLVRPADHAARALQVQLKVVAQSPITLGIAIPRKLAGTLPQALQEALSPQCHGKACRIEPGRMEIVRVIR